MYMIYRISGLFFACHTICDLKKILIATTTGCRFRVLYRCDNKKDFKNIITKVTGYTIYYLAFFVHDTESLWKCLCFLNVVFAQLLNKKSKLCMCVEDKVY